MHDEVSSRSGMERGPALRVLVEDKQDVSRGTLPSATASITMVREPERGTPLGRDVAGGNCVTFRFFCFLFHFYRSNVHERVPRYC
ncbi:hypothetical protein X777_06831 [Ooceraea biroi]|uniref:Uncharacterized protein n=1 Tax=Ooceraea biroi TaxID=2015173 RepID=A0A026WFC8_OOCBI|nr:hypothetical protein X777_06831 [Ooceraea biroi]